MSGHETTLRWGMLFSELVIYFFIYAVLGWAWEKVYCSINAGHIVPRGFLLGPYCPVYGFGVLLVLYLVHPYISKNIFVLFFMAVIITTALEYFTGLGLLKLFHLKLWDYSGYKFNIQGLICPPVSIFWGIGSIFVIKFIQPKVTQAVDFLFTYFGISISVLIILVMGADFILSVLRAVKHNAINK